MAQASTSSISPSVIPVIVFLDVDSFECQIWQRDRPNTRGKPCVVANSSGRIVAATYEAKALGVSRSETPNLRTAEKKCADLVIFRKPDKWGKQDQSKLRKVTVEIVSHIQTFLKEFGTGDDVILEVASSDEFYLDISGEVSRGMERKEKKGKEQRQSIPGFQIPPNVVWERRKYTRKGPFFYRLPKKPKKNQLGMICDVKTYSYKNEERLMFGALLLSQLCGYLEHKTALQISGGVAKNKLLAKVGCGLNKPRKITVFYEEACLRVSKLVDLKCIPGLGGAAGEKLAKTFGISTMGGILKVPYGELEEAFGKEKATQFISWALGRDIEPVVPKLFHDHIKCNKPSGDIKTFSKLETVLKNLTSEIQMFLDEERTHHSRTATKVRVEFKMESQSLSGQNNNNLDSHVFDIKESKSLSDFHEHVLSHFVDLPSFSRDSVHITELAFVLKNFTTTNPSEEQLICMAVEKMFVSLPSTVTPPTLRVHVELNDTAKVPQFDHSFMGGFRITSDLQYSTADIDIPVLINDEKLQSLVGYNLLTGFNTPRLVIQDYNTYTELKHKFFSKWLQENRAGNKDLDDIKFVTFHGRILRSIKTILTTGRFGEWETYGMNVDNVIYLWDEISVRTKLPYNQTEADYMGEVFEQIVSGRGPRPGGFIDVMNKVFPIQKLAFGNHKLLVLCNVDAQEEGKGEFAQVQLKKEETRRGDPCLLVEKNLKLWGQAVASGANKVVIGYKNANNRITRIRSISVDDLFKLSSSIENKDKCFVFLNRLLEWINGHLPAHNHKLVKKFSWIPGQAKVTSSVIPEKEVEKLLLPRIYFPKK